MPEVSRFLGIVIRFNYNECLTPSNRSSKPYVPPSLSGSTTRRVSGVRPLEPKSFNPGFPLLDRDFHRERQVRVDSRHLQCTQVLSRRATPGWSLPWAALVLSHSFTFVMT